MSAALEAMLQTFTYPTNKAMSSKMQMSPPWRIHAESIGCVEVERIGKKYVATVTVAHRATPTNHDIYFLDVDRVGMPEHDNHASGAHSNLLLCYGGECVRVDPYYAESVPDTLRMQRAIDRATERLLKPTGKPLLHWTAVA